MRDLDDGVPAARAVLRRLYGRTGRAHVVGITGAPGSGKSTLADRLVEAARRQGLGVGVVAVDPSSHLSGGAVLGDRVRMQRHARDPKVFIRSLATRGSLGGLSRSVFDTVTVLDAMGKDLILIETAGVGQDGVKVAGAAHTVLVVLAPGAGDEIQAIKAGVLEIGDIYVVNKSDLAQADATARGLRLALDPGWHTYWRDPGDAGLPTTLQFTLPPGVHVGALQWPKPRVFKAAGDLTCYGYEGKALLLAAITVDPGYSAESLALRAKATWLVCKDICQPGKADVILVLHRQKAFAASAQAPLFARLRPGLGQPPEGYLPSKAR